MPGLQRLASLMQAALVGAFLLALGGAFIPGAVGHASGVACVLVLIGAPILRVAWLTTSWARTGDRRFATMGVLLLLVLTTGAVIALVR